MYLHTIHVRHRQTDIIREIDRQTEKDTDRQTARVRETDRQSETEYNPQ